MGELQRRVEIWSIPDRECLTQFDTVLDFGGRRLALCETAEGPVVVAGAWERHGVCGYDALTGESIWQRKDLKRVQYLNPAGKGDLVAAGFEDRPLHVLNARTGATRATVRGARKFWQSRFGPVGCAEIGGQVALIDAAGWAVRWKAAVSGFALLGTAFSKNLLLASSAIDPPIGASTYCFSLSGALLWRHEHDPETLALDLARDDDADEWVAFVRNVNHRAPDTLFRWSDDGELRARLPIGPPKDAAFLPSGRALIVDDVELVDTRTGAHRRH